MISKNICPKITAGMEKKTKSRLGFCFEYYFSCYCTILLCSSIFLNEENHPLGIAVCMRIVQTGRSPCSRTILKLQLHLI